MINIFPGINGQQGTLTADAYNIYLSSFAYGTSLSGPQPYITVNLKDLYNACNTKLTMQAYGYAGGGNYGAKIILNGGFGGGGSISFINDTTTSCTMTTNGTYITGSVGIYNNSPIGMLCVGNSATAGNDGTIVVGKQDYGGGTRHLKMGYNAGFSFVFGDFGNSNTAGTWVEQFRIIYSAPAQTLVCYGDGNVGTKFGNVVSTSDERLKTDIHTIENALEKTLLLRGVNFTYIQEQTKSIGLISQEVELIIPEVVHEYDGIKSIAYSNMIGLLVEAIKELNNKIINLENKII
jgi:hypothetical protein